MIALLLNPALRRNPSVTPTKTQDPILAPSMPAPRQYLGILRDLLSCFESIAAGESFKLLGAFSDV